MRRAVVVVIALVLAAAGIAAGLSLRSGQARCSCLAAQLLSPSTTSPSPPDTRSLRTGAAGVAQTRSHYGLMMARASIVS